MGSLSTQQHGVELNAPGSVGDVRRGNLARVLGAIALADANEYPTRAQLATLTGLTKASVSSLVADLISQHLVKEIGQHRDGERGRPGVGLSLDPTRCVLGMEVNVDYISVGLVELSGQLLSHTLRRQNNRASDPEKVVETLTQLVVEICQAAQAQGLSILGGALAIPGLVDAGGNKILRAPNLGWDAVELNLSALLPEAPLGVSLHNEANASALAQQHLNPRAAANFLFVSGEVGIGGGLVIDSELFLGPQGHAGELGHVLVQPEGERCSCGARGCLETVAGQDAIFRAAGIGPKDAGSSPKTSAESRVTSLAQLQLALRNQDPQAVAAVSRAGQSLAMAVASAVRLFDVSTVVLGGHFADLGPWILPLFERSLQMYAPAAIAPENISLSSLGTTGALVGAAYSVVRSLLEAPQRLG